MNWNNYYAELLKFKILKSFDIIIRTGEHEPFMIKRIYEQG